MHLHWNSGDINLTVEYKAAEGLDETGLPAESYIPAEPEVPPPAPGGQTVFDADHH